MALRRSEGLRWPGAIRVSIGPGMTPLGLARWRRLLTALPVCSHGRKRITLVNRPRESLARGRSPDLRAGLRLVVSGEGHLRHLVSAYGIHYSQECWRHGSSGARTADGARAGADPSRQPGRLRAWRGAR